MCHDFNRRKWIFNEKQKTKQSQNELLFSKWMQIAEKNKCLLNQFSTCTREKGVGHGQSIDWRILMNERKKNSLIYKQVILIKPNNHTKDELRSINKQVRMPLLWQMEWKKKKIEYFHKHTHSLTYVL